jgi:hypothetical protein
MDKHGVIRAKMQRKEDEVDKDEGAAVQEGGEGDRGDAEVP